MLAAYLEAYIFGNFPFISSGPEILGWDWELCVKFLNFYFEILFYDSTQILPQGDVSNNP
jgi:hypothetical protein